MVSARKRIWGWYFFDWASQPYNTLLLTFIFGPYFAEVARGTFMGQGMEADAASAMAQAWWGWGLAIASVLIAVLAPILGAIADSTGRRLVWVWVFSAFYVAGAWGLWWVAPGGDTGILFWAVASFGLGFIGMEFATIFTNALMPSLSEHEEMGAISGSGFAFGYLGGLLALVIMLLLFAEGADSGKTLIGIEPLFGLDPRRARHALCRPFHRAVVRRLHAALLPVGEGAADRAAAAASGPGDGVLARVAGILALSRQPVGLPRLVAVLPRCAECALWLRGVYASGVLGWSIIQIGTFGVVGACRRWWRPSSAGGWTGGSGRSR